MRGGRGAQCLQGRCGLEAGPAKDARPPPRHRRRSSSRGPRPRDRARRGVVLDPPSAFRRSGLPECACAAVAVETREALGCQRRGPRWPSGLRP